MKKKMAAAWVRPIVVRLCKINALNVHVFTIVMVCKGLPFIRIIVVQIYPGYNHIMLHFIIGTINGIITLYYRRY